MPARTDLDWKNWLQRLDRREPTKKRYQRYYEFLDQDVPGWHHHLNTPEFFAWGSTRDPQTGSCFFDMMIQCWHDPAGTVGYFATFLRLYLRHIPKPSATREGIFDAFRKVLKPTKIAAPPHRSVLSDRYEIIKPLGSGGNGQVYLAWSRETTELYALKIIRPELCSDPDSVQRFKKEIDIWVRLGTHPNIVQSRFLDIKDNVLYMTMEYIEEDLMGGPSLADRIRHQTFGDALLARWFIEIADGLSHGYDHGIQAHRDLKPANILITRDGIAKVTDFGLASPLTAQTASVGIHSRNWVETAPGSAFGTPIYMAPEQFKDARYCDQRSDIYSLGVTLYQAISGGRPPFLPKPLTPKNANDFDRFIRGVQALHEQAIPDPLNSPFWSIIEKCLAKQPADRFQSIGAFSDAIRRLAQAKGYAIPEKPANVEDIWSYRDKGNTLMHLGQYEDAILAFDQFLAHFPDDSTSFNKAVCLGNTGKPREAIQILESFYQNGDSKAFINASACHVKLGEYSEALDLAYRATELSASDEGSWIALGNAYFYLAPKSSLDPQARSRMELFTESVVAYTRATELSPHSATAHYNLALSQNSVGDIDGAAKSFRRFLEYADQDDPRRADAVKILSLLK